MAVWGRHKLLQRLEDLSEVVVLDVLADPQLGVASELASVRPIGQEVEDVAVHPEADCTSRRRPHCLANAPGKRRLLAKCTLPDCAPAVQITHRIKLVEFHGPPPGATSTASAARVESNTQRIV